jgi:hypothetical protein
VTIGYYSRWTARTARPAPARARGRRPPWPWFLEKRQLGDDNDDDDGFIFVSRREHHCLMALAF